ncbi:RNA 2',3'-cyclic phosphodiesterase [Methanorbis rubei]|uniref:RNA 2',3'-cyclic phosphodiesterase n=1 Tax=Methanorbis rubei TaxID=3028300 RepID=A0AAE4SBJ1_9EURY|nr:RNA 2',3'-cyclic phosphodiesterase [Methanocorpusculaceae archaeon Cs1]
MARLFIAVEPSSEIRNNLAAAAQSLLGTSARLSVVGASQMHITLKFLGEVPDSKIPKIITTFSELHGEPYQLSASGVGVFGRPTRVIKAEVKDNGASKELASKLDSLLSSIGIPKETQPFSPHLTLARVKEYSPDILPKVAAVKDADFGSCTIDKVALKKSTLTPSGPIYETIAEVKL